MTVSVGKVWESSFYLDDIGKMFRSLPSDVAVAEVQSLDGGGILHTLADY